MSEPSQRGGIHILVTIWQQCCGYSRDIQVFHSGKRRNGPEPEDRINHLFFTVSFSLRHLGSSNVLWMLKYDDCHRRRESQNGKHARQIPAVLIRLRHH